MVATAQADRGICGGCVDHARTKRLNVERVVAMVVVASHSQPGTPIALENLKQLLKIDLSNKSGGEDIPPRAAVGSTNKRKVAAGWEAQLARLVGYKVEHGVQRA